MGLKWKGTRDLGLVGEIGEGPGLFCLFSSQISLYSPGCPETRSIDQADLELTEICLPAARIKGVYHHCTVGPRALIYGEFVLCLLGW